MIRAGELACLLRGPFEGGEDVEKQRRQRHEMIVVADHRISGWNLQISGFRLACVFWENGSFPGHGIFVLLSPAFFHDFLFSIALHRRRAIVMPLFVSVRSHPVDIRP